MTLTAAGKLAGLVGAATTIVGGLIGYALAEGAPTLQPLFYGGMVTSRDGTPLDATHSVSLSLLAAESGGTALCSTPALAAEFKAGRFRVALPSGDKGCAQAVSNNPDTWVELTVDGTTFPRTKVGAMPYALEAGHAKSASAVSGPQAETLTELAASVAALKASLASGPAAPVPAPAAPKLSYRFISEGAGCAYLADFNATRCTCEPGEIVVSPGGWAGPTGVLNASRFERAADEEATDIDRSRIWTISCLTLTGAPLHCIGVQALCVKN
jgi:hypothetical protein